MALYIQNFIPTFYYILFQNISIEVNISKRCALINKLLFFLYHTSAMCGSDVSCAREPRYSRSIVPESYRTQFSKYPMQETVRVTRTGYGPGVHKMRWTPPDAQARSSVSRTLLRSSWRVGHDARRFSFTQKARCALLLFFQTFFCCTNLHLSQCQIHCGKPKKICASSAENQQELNLLPMKTLLMILQRILNKIYRRIIKDCSQLLEPSGSAKESKKKSDVDMQSYLKIIIYLMYVLITM